MTLPYLLRLLCMSLAAWFVVHAAAGLILAVAGPGLIRWVRGMDARRGAAILLSARLAPGLSAAITVLVLCVPSYLSLEDERGAEYVGYKCLALAAIGAILLMVSAARVSHALARSRRYMRACRSLGSTVRLEESAAPVLVVEEKAPFLAIAGIVKPSVLISRGVLEALAPDHMAAALRHERAHRESRDNLKRLCLCAAPGLVPFAGGFQRIEREWAKLAEWAADDRAAEGDAGRSLSLAEALVRMARMGSLPKCSTIESLFVSATTDVAERVDRLLGTRISVAPRVSRPVRKFAAAGSGLAALGVTAAQPATMALVHGVLERLMH
jgi:Zn-dependent protease with chaperone function